MSRAAHRLALAIGAATGLAALERPASAQDDGARLYMMVPDKTTIASLRFHHLDSNLAVDPGTVSANDLDTFLVVFQFVQAFSIAGSQSFIFLVVPGSRIRTNAAAPGSEDKISGLGDVQLGFVHGIFGTPVLGPADYASHRPGLAVNLLAKLFFPTGAYSPSRSINIGANRWALRLGIPIVYAIGDRMADPHLVTIEAMPTITFFGANDDPYGAGRTQQKPLFIFEGHLTRGLTDRIWGSLDLLWREGGSVSVGEGPAAKRQSALSLGATGTFALGGSASLRLSAGSVVARNANGPNGWMLRATIGTVF
jgi:hypothetical protein